MIHPPARRSLLRIVWVFMLARLESRRRVHARRVSAPDGPAGWDGMRGHWVHAPDRQRRGALPTRRLPSTSHRLT